MPWKRKSCWTADAWWRLDSSFGPQYGSDWVLGSPEALIPRDEDSSEDDRPFLPRFLLQEIIFAHTPYEGVSHNRPSQGGFACDELQKQNARSSRYEDSLPILGTARANISDQDSALRCVGSCRPQNMCAWCQYTRHGDVLNGHMGWRGRGGGLNGQHHTATAPPHHTTPHTTSVGQAVEVNGIRGSK